MLSLFTLLYFYLIDFVSKIKFANGVNGLDEGIYLTP